MASTITIWLFWVLLQKAKSFFCRRKTKEDNTVVNSLQLGREMAQGSQGLSFALVSRGTVVLAEHA